MVVPLVAPLVAPPADAQTTPGRAPWWDAGWHFRLPLTLDAEGQDPVTGEPASLRGVEDPLVLVPVDFTQALRDGEAPWPFDTAGRPLAWTFSPESLRVVELDANGAPTGAPLPARFLPSTLGADANAAGAAPYDPQTNARGTLALLVTGTLDAPRHYHVYFDIAERGTRAPLPVAPVQAARLDALAGVGPAVSFFARAPSLPPGASLNLVAIPLGDAATLTVERLAPGAAAEPLHTDVAVRAPVTRLALPPSGTGYDLRARASSPVLLAFETVQPGRAAAAHFFPDTDGGFAGTRFLVPGLAGQGDPAADIIAGVARAEVVVKDAASGAELSRGAVSRGASLPLRIPAGGAVVVEASAPVLVLARGAGGASGSAFLHQALSAEGAPEATTLHGGRAAGHAAVAPTPGTLKAFPLARPGDLASGRVGDAPRYAWVARGAAAAQSEPWTFLSDGPRTSVLLGSDGYAPLSGTSGLAFRFAFASDAPLEATKAHPMAGALLTPFPDTRVTVTASGLDGAPIASATTTLSSSGSLDAFPDGSRPLLEEGHVYVVEADKPVFLYAQRPGSAATAFLPGLPPLAGAEVGTLESFGALLAWVEPTRNVVARPGERLSVAAELSNRGRASDGSPLVEDVALDLHTATGRCEGAWDAGLATPSLPAFPAPGERRVDVLVEVPSSARPGDCMELVLRASSSQEAGRADEMRLVIRVRSGFEPELRILDPREGPVGAATATLDAGANATVRLRLANRGAEDGEAMIGHGPAGDYELRLRDAATGDSLTDASGRGAKAIVVPANGSVDLLLDARAPTGTEAPWDVFVQATSVADPSVRDGVSLSLLVRANVTLEATTDTRRVTPVPGAAANATITLRNLGADLDVRLRIASTLPDGWRATFTPDRLLLRANGTEGLDTAPVVLQVEAPPNAKVGDAVPLTVAVEPTLTPAAGLRVALTALAANDYRVEHAPPAPLAAAPAASGTTRVAFDSRAAGPFDPTLRSVEAPAGWNVTVQGLPARVAPGETAGLRIDYRTEPGAPAGRGAIVLDLALNDGVSPAGTLRLSLPVVTLDQPVLRVIGAPSVVALDGGETQRVRLQVANDGNAPATVQLSLDIGAGVEAVLADAARATFPLAPGEQRAADVVLTAIAGASRGEATLTVAGAPEEVRVVLATRPTVRDLSLVSAQLDSSDGAGVATFVVRNAGERAVPGVLVELQADGATVASFRFGGLAAGAEASHAIPVGAPAGSLSLMVQSSDGAPDATPDDNLVTLATTEPTRDMGGALGRFASQEIPLPPLPLLLAALLGGALATRRWRV